ncbi:HAD-IIA family hydrolase [Haloarchaeobius iranensis]|uniref:Arabinose operon protein AraL n=1 Tax=Haloarchaeobius iranensis TaxID=996166 RepID=A0A1G9UU26_9EURY|nr:HAD-IIA family hydrolase [Haloarchaeobius iranensis]SDM63464.1 arabinose operon protein AraL [Haloarchaeobius iranensis]
MTRRAAIVDLDGTVWRGETVIPGAAEGIDALVDAGLAIRFVTNSTSVDREAFPDTLESMGIPGDVGGISTAASATATYLAEHHPDAEVYVVGSDVLYDEIREAGLTVVSGRDPSSRPRDVPPADVVAAGKAYDIDFALLTETLRAFDQGTLFVATNTDQTFPTEEGLKPGAGCTVGAIEGMTGRDPLVVGKPSEHMADAVTERLGVAPGECLVVGDNLHTDILMGERAGMETVLVLTGATRREEIGGSGVEPDHVVDSLGDVAGIL